MNLFFKILSGIVFLPVWHLQKCFRRDRRVWLFGSWFGQKYSDNSRALYEYVLENRKDIRPVWITHNRDVYDRLKKENLPVTLAGTRECRRISRKAGVAFYTTSPLELAPRWINGAFGVWLWHGIPLKQIMADENVFLRKNQSAFKRFKVRINRSIFPWENTPPSDCVISPSDFYSPFFASAFELPLEKVWADGYPRNDLFFKDRQKNIAWEYRKKYPDARFIVYMPTHRINSMHGRPFSGFDGFGFDSQRLFDTLEKENCVFFNKCHFHDSAASIQMENERFHNVTESDYDNLYDFVKEMDILITDFSGMYFDWLLLRKPVILAPFDYDDYVSHERPLYFEYDKLKAVRANDWDSLLKVLSERSYFKPSDEEIRLFHNHPDGESCRRITEHVIHELQI